MPSKMRPFGRVIALDEARALIEGAVRPIDRTETVGLVEGNGRVLAQNIISTADVPPFARAAMDGYAVRSEDTIGASRTVPRTLRRIETIFTGQVPRHRIEPGHCAEIATGAPMPDGADSVVMVEDTDINQDGIVAVFAATSAGQNIGRKGADIRLGQHVLGSGTVLNASRLGALAALGIATIQVFARPRVAIISTGNEIVDAGRPLAPGQIYDINRITVAAVVSDNGGLPVPYRTATDTIDDIARSLDESLQQDLIVFSGGSSVGERDLILDVISSRGEVLFHGIAVKPGKPTALGRIDGKLVFGMPGYPTSCLSNAYILLAPALRAVSRLPPPNTRSFTLPLGSRVTSAPGRHQFYSVRVEDGRAVPAFKASGDITSMSQADGYIEIAADVESVEAGTMVDVKLF